MRVAKLEAIPVSVPYTHTEVSSRVARGGVTDVIIRLTADNGLVGWGESCSGPDTLSIVNAVEAMAPFVLGRDPWDTEAIARDIFTTALWDRRAHTGHFAFAGIDMALWDLCGKAAGQPLFRLFGGAQREAVDYFCYLSRGTPDAVAAQSRDGLARGHTCFYLKVGVDRAAEAAMLEAIRATVGPAARLRIDANEAWSLPEAADILNEWHARFRLDFAEAPVRVTPEIMRDLKARTPVALCANEGLETPQQVARIITTRAADVLCFSSYWVGSLRRVLTLSHMAELEGMTICKHTHGELGLAAAAGQHLMLAIPNASDGAQQTATVTADDILTDPLPIATGARWGRIEGPGLGVEVDLDKLGRYAEAFRRDGQFRPYGDRVPDRGRAAGSR